MSVENVVPVQRVHEYSVACDVSDLRPDCGTAALPLDQPTGREGSESLHAVGPTVLKQSVSMGLLTVAVGCELRLRGSSSNAVTASRRACAALVGTQPDAESTWVTCSVQYCSSGAQTHCQVTTVRISRTRYNVMTATVPSGCSALRVRAAPRPQGDAAPAAPPPQGGATGQLRGAVGWNPAARTTVMSGSCVKLLDIRSGVVAARLESHCV